jgi:alanyl-tRNA synthetase
MKITSGELREKFLKFFESKGHKIIPSASLVPENDPTVLFTTAGMQPLVPYLLGQKHPDGTRLASCQKCIRTGDIDDVGDDTHCTYFEMLGNWSLGDYGKKEAIEFSFEFLMKELGVPLERFAVTCFEGDDDAPRDTEAAGIWQNLGIKEERIAFLPKEDNWWGPAGKTGPCGPDSEMFYWKNNSEPAPKVFDPKNKNWVEIWNDVFMQYVKNEEGKIIDAKQKNIDTGMGLERAVAVLNGKDNVYKTDLFDYIIAKIEEISGRKYINDVKSFRVIADHLRTATFIIGDNNGISPSNVGQGYIVRRLIRRAVRFGKKLGITKNNWTKDIAQVVIEKYIEIYPELSKNKGFVISELSKEEERFALTLENGLRELAKIDTWFVKEKNQSTTTTAVQGLGLTYQTNKLKDQIYSELGKKLFDLFQRSGFPLELSLEEMRNYYGNNFSDYSIKIVTQSFEDEFKNHQELSRTASAGMFKGGLADAGEQATKYHTATHLLLAALRKTLSPEVYQKGSNITAERMRFDFNWPEKLSTAQIQDAENFVNDIINKDLPVSFEEVSLEQAKEIGAMGVFEDKYGERVKVYTIADEDNIVSREICGGPHVEHTGVLGHFKIQKEESSSAGVRRIKAILE